MEYRSFLLTIVDESDEYRMVLVSNDPDIIALTPSPLSETIVCLSSDNDPLVAMRATGVESYQQITSIHFVLSWRALEIAELLIKEKELQRDLAAVSAKLSTYSFPERKDR